MDPAFDYNRNQQDQQRHQGMRDARALVDATVPGPTPELHVFLGRLATVASDLETTAQILLDRLSPVLPGPNVANATGSNQQSAMPMPPRLVAVSPLAGQLDEVMRTLEAIDSRLTHARQALCI